MSSVQGPERSALESLTVSEVLTSLQQVVVAGFPAPIWVRGEITGFRRTSQGAVFFRLADPDVADVSLDVAARGRTMFEVDRTLADAGLGGLRDGVEVRLRGTIGVDSRRSVVRLALLEVDPAFTTGRLAIDRAELLRRLSADGSLLSNRRHPLPMVPLRVGLVTSRGSAAHGDFIDQLRRSGYRFAVRTVHTNVQGDSAGEQIAAALARFDDTFDIVALVRGGGSQLDLAVFDTEPVARAIAEMPVPVITGVGHDIDRTIADESAAVSEKTPSAAGEWLVARVHEFSTRLSTARHMIRDEARSSLARQEQLLRGAAASVAASSTALARQRDILEGLRGQIGLSSRELLQRHRASLESLTQWFAAVDVEATLRRGFSVVTRVEDGAVVRSVGQVAAGDQLSIRLSDGTVRVTVDQ
ncbi:MAG TPA: exodeoxyribonuclease VII large subunit [Acidimicrobiia bacterium]